VRTEADWRTLCSIVDKCSRQPNAAAAALGVLEAACGEPAALSAASYMPLLEMNLMFADRYKVGLRGVSVC
jgi:hypothetical protein